MDRLTLEYQRLSNLYGWRWMDVDKTASDTLSARETYKLLMLLDIFPKLKFRTTFHPPKDFALFWMK